MSRVIEEPPRTRACSTCMRPVTWVYVFHLDRIVGMVPVPGVDRFTAELHTCNLKDEWTWRHVQRVDPRIAARGARRAREVLKARARQRAGEAVRGG